jgi:uncharacterized protein (TIGR03545 family)
MIMTKWIRWSGIAGFLLFVALVSAFWMLAAGPLLKMAIEKYGSEAAGAQVNVADVSFGVSPLSITITGVQVADKDTPMENMVSFDTAIATLEPFPLLLGKAIIPDVTLSGVALGTARNRSGALKPSTSESAPSGAAHETGSAEPETSIKILPSADEILDREKLLTVERGEALQLAYKQHQTAIEDAVANLPTENTINSYQQQLNAILKGKFKNVEDFKQRKKEFDALKAQFKTDKAAIATAKNSIKDGKSDLKQKWSQLKTSPSDDLENLKSKYKLDGAGASNLAALLFGEDAGGYAQTALGYYEKVRPFLVDEEAKATKKELKEKRLEGRFVHFDSDRPMPDFWIKTLNFSMALPAMATNSAGEKQSLGQVAVKVTDITHQQNILNLPTRILAIGKNLKDIKSLTINGELDHRVSPGKDSFNLEIDRWNVRNLKMGLAGLRMVSSYTDVKGSAVFSNGEMNVVANGLFKNAVFDSKKTSTFAKEMVLALKNVDQFTVDTTAKGQLKSPKVNLKSNLDAQLKSAFNQRVDQKQAALEAKLKGKLNDKLMSYGGDYQQQLKDLNITEGSLADKAKALEKLGKTEISSYEDQLKAEAKEKEDAEKARVKQQRDAEKARAKEKSDNKLKQQEQKLKDQFKKLF